MVCNLLSMPNMQEDELLRKLVGKHGARNWSLMAKSIPGRTGKSCRLRCGAGGPVLVEQVCSLSGAANMSAAFQGTLQTKQVNNIKSKDAGGWPWWACGQKSKQAILNITIVVDFASTQFNLSHGYLRRQGPLTPL